MTRVARIALALLIGVGLGLTVTGPRIAAASVESPAGVATVSECGTGYNLIDVYHMFAPGTSAIRGEYELYWNGTRNCGIARCYNNCGQTLWRWAAIADDDGLGWDDQDGPGQWTNHAGPVKSDPSAGECIDLRAWFGTTDDPVGDELIAQVWKTNVHCG